MMAELLIRASDSTHPDPIKDRRGCYKRGDIVSVFEDGGIDGKKMGPPVFYVVKLPGVPIAAVQALREEQTEDDAGNPHFTGLGTVNPESTTYRRRSYRLDIDGLNQGMRNRLEKDGVLSLPPGQIKAFLKRKRDNKQFDGI